MSRPDDPTSLHPMPDPAEDQVAALLADVLITEASRVEPADRLSDIRAAGAGRGLSWAPVAAAVAFVVAIGGGTWALVDRDAGGRHPVGSPTSPPTTVASSRPTSPTASSSTAPATAVTVPVYFPATQVKGLFREFLRTRSQDNPERVVERALQLAVDPTAPTKSGDVSRWLPGTTAALSASFANREEVVVRVPASEGQARGRSAEDARLAAQQLVWTATAVTQDPRLRVSIEVGSGNGAKLFGSLPLGKPFVRPSAAMSYVDLSAIWILQPEPGATVRDPVVVSGQACTFEANVAWQVLRGATVVRSGQTTSKLGCPVRSAWSVTVKGLPAGSYTFRAFEISAKGDGSYEGLDTLPFTVR
jgi:Immunoglobulin-like domain of bacterial spore germination/Sporulation and spore germination